MSGARAARQTLGQVVNKSAKTMPIAYSLDGIIVGGGVM